MPTAPLTTAPLYSKQRLVCTGDVNQEKLKIGDVVMTNDDTSSEAQMRLYAISDDKGGYCFNPNFGSKLLTNINKRGISNNTIVLQVKQALAPMVQQGKITDNIVVIPTITNYNISIDITLTAPNGKQVQFVWSTYLNN